MEVHHHTHTPRKKWTHYFWEFLMLFLAVFCGFMAENQREHMVEHKREKQYIQSMMVDLETDTSKLTKLISSHKEIVEGVDSILNTFDQFTTGLYTRSFFKYQWTLNGFVDFIYTDRTIEQLKNSGGMRLIRKQAASDSIIAYDDNARDYLIEQDGLQRVYNNVESALNRILNLRLVRKEFEADPHQLAVSKSIDLLLTHDKQELEEFYNMLYLYRNAVSAKANMAASLKQKAIRLVAFLKEEYHIK